MGGTILDNIKKVVAGTLIIGLSIAIIPFNSIVYASTILKTGSTGSQVREVQELLLSHGLIKESHITGYYGPITYNAVKAFQNQAGIKSDGIVGPATIQKLKQSNLSGKTFKLGDQHPEVSTIQNQLEKLGYYRHCRITEYYGPITVEAIKEFQRVNGLKVDGIAGNATIGKLFSANAKSKSSSGNQSSNETSRGTTSSTTANDIVNFAQKYQGVPYVYGANGPSAFDCSGFTSFVFKNFGISLPRSANAQGNAAIGTKISNRGDLQPGDLVFFTNSRGSERPVHHAGIYIGGGNFIHASSSKRSRKVIVSNLNSGYYKEGFCWGRRVLR